MHFAGFGLAGYRSFYGGATQNVALRARVHLLAGANNSGKSNILRFAQTYLPQLAGQISSPQGDDRPIGENVSTQFQIALAVENDEASLAARLSHVEPEGTRAQIARYLSLLLALPAYLGESGVSWILSNPTADGKFEFEPDVEQARAAAEQFAPAYPDESPSWRNIAQHMTGGRYDSGSDLAFLRTIAGGLKLERSTPPVETISAFRQLRPGEDDQIDHSGVGLIARLAKLQQPRQTNHAADERRWEAINEFVQSVLDDPDARLRIPSESDQILVSQGGRVLDLQNLGTGVHEVVILAAAATVLENTFVCVEEPEVHLHPVLQRRLLAYLNERTSNQYLIATHSAHLLDTNVASVSHVSLGEKGTEVSSAVAPRELAQIAWQLGYRPSDLVQANAVVWVEGPSDAIYLRHWLGLFASDIEEGLHFSLMMYGGPSLSHLTVEDFASDLISLVKLNRHLAVVIDSDLTTSAGVLTANKQRIVDELAEAGGFSWVTSGYTIENYVPVDVLRVAVSSAHPSAIFEWAGSIHSNPLQFGDGSPAVIKTKVAQRVIASTNEETAWPTDLVQQLHALANVIREWNDLPHR